LAFDELKIESVSLPVDAWQPERNPWVLDANISAAQKRLTAAESDLKKSELKVLVATKSEEKAKKEKEEVMIINKRRIFLADIGMGFTGLALGHAAAIWFRK